MKRSIVLTLAAGVVLAPSPATAQEEEAAAPGPEPTASRWESQHSIVVGRETVEYDAVLGSIILRDQTEKASAELFYTAYFRTNAQDRATRPIIFSYNGGPGSASF